MPSKYFYDKKGSELFEEITNTEEYYPTRTEISLLETYHTRPHSFYLFLDNSSIKRIGGCVFFYVEIVS
ncbi:L-histidine N(alpha)-methyltransferase [Metabacillus sp. RGM 3146]|uniref:L-histidine N(alpha)-methyltransferase n=1 Tax=Metabacillus sp. RGM 3146 TaxID=3401092 RepID=UPI003B99F759